MKFSIVLGPDEDKRLTDKANAWRQKKAPLLRAVIMGQTDIVISFLDISEAKKAEILRLLKCES